MQYIYQDLFDTVAHKLLTRQLDALTEHFVYPMPLYHGDNLQVFGAPCTFKEVLAIYREAIETASVTHIKPRIVAQGVVINKRSSIWVEWDHFQSADRPTLTSQVSYVLVHRDMTALPKIEMIEYKFTAFPKVTEQFASVKHA